MSKNNNGKKIKKPQHKFWVKMARIQLENRFLGILNTKKNPKKIFAPPPWEIATCVIAPNQNSCGHHWPRVEW